MLHSPSEPDRALTIADQSGGPVQHEAATDTQLISLWLHGRSEHTIQAYKADAERFLGFVDTPLCRVTLQDTQDYADRLEQDGLQPASRHRILSAIKSLIGFAHRLGYLPFDVARPLRLPAVRDTLNERMLDEGEVQRLIALEPNPRNHVALMLLYVAGVRVSELCGLKWRDLQLRDDGGQMTVFGKRGKTRTILLPQGMWDKLTTLREEAADAAPVFCSRRGGHLHRSQLLRIIRKAAVTAGIDKPISPHWMRHAHASHALDRNCPIHLVQATLGHSSVATTGRYLHARPNDSSSRYLPL